MSGLPSDGSSDPFAIGRKMGYVSLAQLDWRRTRKLPHRHRVVLSGKLALFGKNDRFAIWRNVGRDCPARPGQVAASIVLSGYTDHANTFMTGAKEYPAIRVNVVQAKS